MLKNPYNNSFLFDHIGQFGIILNFLIIYLFIRKGLVSLPSSPPTAMVIIVSDYDRSFFLQIQTLKETINWELNLTFVWSNLGAMSQILHSNKWTKSYKIVYCSSFGTGLLRNQLKLSKQP